MYLNIVHIHRLLLIDRREINGVVVLVFYFINLLRFHYEVPLFIGIGRINSDILLELVIGVHSEVLVLQKRVIELKKCYHKVVVFGWIHPFVLNKYLGFVPSASCRGRVSLLDNSWTLIHVVALY